MPTAIRHLLHRRKMHNVGFITLEPDGNTYPRSSTLRTALLSRRPGGTSKKLTIAIPEGSTAYQDFTPREIDDLGAYVLSL